MGRGVALRSADLQRLEREIPEHAVGHDHQLVDVCRKVDLRAGGDRVECLAGRGAPAFVGQLILG